MTDGAFLAAAAGRRLLLDGAMATYVHAERGTHGHVGACDTLSISSPRLVHHVHDAYLAAGADIVRTNTFRAASREHAGAARDLCFAAARIAREAAGAWTQHTPDRARFVAGALGPADDDDSLERLRTAYRAPLTALLRARVDLVMLETCWAPAHAAAALAACRDAASDCGHAVPVIVSMALDARQRLAVSGAPIDDLLAAIEPVAGGQLVGLGINCGPGPHGLGETLGVLRRHAALVTCHPSAGLPDAQHRYPVAPEGFARHVSAYAAAGLVDLVGGCCGTTPAHVAALAPIGSQ